MKQLFILLAFSIFFLPTFSQDKVEKFTMEDVIRLARDRSPDAFLAINRFRSSYWQYRSFQANYLPSLGFTGTLPSISRTIRKTTKDDGTDQYTESKSNFFSGSLSLLQNIGLTGGRVSLNSELERTDQLTQRINSSTGLPESIPTQYAANPVLNIRLDQPLFAYNSMKWDRKIQPMLYDEAKKNYLDAMEYVTIRAIGRFFDLALAQLNLKISKVNYSNSDTLYKIAKGRYNLGTIAENDVLQMELAFLNAKTALTKAEVDLEYQKSKLRSFLAFTEKIDFELILPDHIPSLDVEYQKVLDLALQNNADVVGWNRRLIEAKRDVAQAKGQRRSINLSASYGLSKSTENDLPPVYQNPGESKGLSIGIGIPLLDWGQGRGRVKMAQSNMELTKVQLQQEQTDFEQNIFLQVMQFNMQDDQVVISAKSDTIGQKRYDVTKQRFLIGKIDVLNLNDALKEKDSAKRSYISALRDYWTSFFTLRQLTLFDFVNNQTLSEEFDKLVE